MNVYYRAMSFSEYKTLENDDTVIGTYWAVSKGDAERYMSEGKVIAKITLSHPLPNHFKKVALYTDGKNHIEYNASVEELDKFIGRTLENVEVA